MQWKREKLPSSSWILERKYQTQQVVCFMISSFIKRWLCYTALRCVTGLHYCHAWRCVTCHTQRQNLVGRCSLAFSCLAPARSFLAPDKAAVPPGSRFEIFEHLPVSTGPGRVHPGVVAVDSLTPIPLTSACTCRIRNQRRPTSHPKAPLLTCYQIVQCCEPYIWIHSPFFSLVGLLLCPILG